MLNVIVNALVYKSQLQSIVTYRNAIYIHLKKFTYNIKFCCEKYIQ